MASLWNPTDREDRDRLQRGIGIALDGSGPDRGDAVDHFHPHHHAAKDSIAESFGGIIPMVQERIIDVIDEELAGGTVNLGSARHSDRSPLVLQAIGGFVLDRRLGGLFLEIGGETAALDHEAFDDPMENGPVVESIIDVGKEIPDGDRRFVGEELDGDVPPARFHQHLRVRGLNCRWTDEREEKNRSRKGQKYSYHFDLLEGRLKSENIRNRSSVQLQPNSSNRAILRLDIFCPHSIIIMFHD